MQTLDAPAKINLALHVTGRRDDGYHLLESFVVFTELSDRVSAQLAEQDRFVLEGPESDELSAEDTTGNLVVRAREALRDEASASGAECAPVELRLDKRLPVASGIGGGSADAAATLKLLCQVWNSWPEPAVLAQIALRLGADVPMCLAGHPLIARGIGDALEPVTLGFPLDLVIVNPRVGVSTPAVFTALENRQNPPLPALPGFEDRGSLVDWLSHTRNDLERPARSIAPEIADCLEGLADSGGLVSRMSGSGASCFGLYRDAGSATAAADRIRRAQPGWFVAATRTLA